MGVTVYGPAFSTCTMRVLAVLAEKEVTDYTQVNVDMSKGEHKAPANLARQPFGQVPSLEDGDFTMFESRAIARYLDDKYADQGTPLFGRSLKEKALINTWVEAEHSNYHTVISSLVYERVFKGMMGGGQPDEARCVELEEKLSKVLDVYEKVLSKQEYLAGNAFSMADLSHVPYGFYLANVAKKPEIFTSRPHVGAWWERITSRPAWKKIESMQQH